MEKNYLEVDFIEIFAKVLLFIKRRFLVMLIFTFVGIILGFADYKITPVIYKSKFITSVGIFTKGEIEAILQTLQNHIDNHDYESLTKITALNERSCQSLIKMTIDTNKTSVNIMLEHSIKEDFDTLRNGLLYFLNNNNYVKTRTTKYKKHILNYLRMINSEMDEIDSLQKMIINSKFPDNQNNFILNYNLSGHKEIVLLAQEKMNVEYLLDSKYDIEIMNDYEISHMAKKSLPAYLAIFGILFTFIGFFIVLIFEMFVAANKYLKTKNK